MKVPKHLIYGLILALLAAYYMYFELFRAKERERHEEREKIVFRMDAGDVDRVVLSRTGEPEIVIERNAERSWSLTSPVRAQADTLEVEELIDRVQHVSRVKPVGEKDVDPAAYGLAEPGFKLRFRTPAGWNGLLVGDRSPVGSEYYAKTEKEAPVFLIAQGDRMTLDKNVFDLRDKKLFDVGTDEVDRFEVTRGPFHVLLARDPQAGWTALGHASMRISKEKVDTVLRKYGWSRVREFVREDDGDLSGYGLDAPQAVVSVSKGERSRTLLLGAPADGGLLFARLKDRLGVVAVEADLLENLPGSLDDLEDRSVIRTSTDAVTGVSWSLKGKKTSMHRDEASDVWVFDAPKSLESRKLESWRAESLLFRVAGIEYTKELTSVPDSLKNLETNVIVLIGSQDEILEAIHLGASPEQDSERVIWVEHGGVARVYTVPKDKVDELTEYLEALESTAA